MKLLDKWAQEYLKYQAANDVIDDQGSYSYSENEIERAFRAGFKKCQEEILKKEETLWVHDSAKIHSVMAVFCEDVRRLGEDEE